MAKVALGLVRVYTQMPIYGLLVPHQVSLNRPLCRVEEPIRTLRFTCPIDTNNSLPQFWIIWIILGLSTIKVHVTVL